MSSELTDLFQRTMPSDEVILHRMAAARARRERGHRPWLRVGQPWISAATGAATCAASLALLLSAPAPVALRAEAERFDAKPANSAQDRAAHPSPPPAASSDASTPAARVPVKAAVGQASANRNPAVPATPAPESPRTPASWDAAARALRSGDQAEAQRLIAELSKSDDPEVRDSALLVRLRSAVHASSSGPERSRLTAEDQARLETLAQSGATASIRAAAHKLLEETRGN